MSDIWVLFEILKNMAAYECFGPKVSKFLSVSNQGRHPYSHWQLHLFMLAHIL